MGEERKDAILKAGFLSRRTLQPVAVRYYCLWPGVYCPERDVSSSWAALRAPRSGDCLKMGTADLGVPCT